MRTCSRQVLRFLFLLLLCPWAALALDIRTTDGREFKKVEIFKREPDRIIITHSKGIATIEMDQLTEDQQKQFGYDPEKARRYKQDKLEREAAERANREVESTKKKVIVEISSIVSSDLMFAYAYLDSEPIEKLDKRASDLRERESVLREREAALRRRKAALLQRDSKLPEPGNKNLTSAEVRARLIEQMKQQRESAQEFAKLQKDALELQEEYERGRTLHAELQNALGKSTQICIAGRTDERLVDDKRVVLTLYLGGRYTYKTMSGAQKTVPLYAMSGALALEIRSNQDRKLPDNIVEGGTSGTGWFTENGIVVTCRHIVKDRNAIYVTGKAFERQKAGIIAEDQANDLVLLSVPRETARRGIPICNEDPVAGENVFTVGFPLPEALGKEPKASSGIVSSLSGVKDDPRMIQVTVPLQPGNSGGPLLNTKGEVVGIVTSKLSALPVLLATGDIPENVNFAVKSGYLSALLKKADRALPSARAPVIAQDISSVVGKVRDSVVIVTAE